MSLESFVQFCSLGIWKLTVHIFQIGGAALTGGLIAAVEERFVLLSVVKMAIGFSFIVY